MAVHGVLSADSVAGAGVTRASYRLDGRWFLHSVSLQNEDVAGPGEQGVIKLQFGTDVYEAARPWHPVDMGLVRVDNPLIFEFGFPVSGRVLVVGEIDHVAAVSHRLTVLAWKIGDR